MGLRELLILLLGLAIVAVILRGLYVALQARRGQIRLAIDKNIPKDVDLEALELAELPGGGARVINRDNTEAESTSADPVIQANSRAETMELGRDDEPVPVLMESVQVGSANDPLRAVAPEPAIVDEEHGEAEAWADESTEDESWEQAESWRAEPHMPALGAAELDAEDPMEEVEEADEVLLDYQAAQIPPVDDGMSAVQPDYPEDEEDEDEEYEENLAGSPSAREADWESDWEEERVPPPAEYGEELNEIEEDASYAYTSSEDVLEASAEDEHLAHHEARNNIADYEEEPGIDDSEDFEPMQEQSTEAPGFNADNLSNDLDSFSMTAGERIGGNPRIDEQGQTLMFDADTTASPPVKRKSLFSALRGRIRSQMANLREHPEQDEAQVFDPEMDIDEDIFVEEESVQAQAVATQLPESIPTEQLDIESTLNEELAPAPEELPRPEPVTTELRAQQAAPQRSEVRQQDTSSQTSEVLVLNVMAREGREFRGEDLLHTCITSGLKFGDMQIFHHRFGNGSTGPVIFSLANILNPGTFDLNAMAQFRTIGVSLFMAMPTPINNLDAFEQMLSVAQQLCAALDGELKDDHRNVMTAQTIEHYRQRIRDFELRQLKTAGSRG